MTDVPPPGARVATRRWIAVVAAVVALALGVATAWWMREHAAEPRHDASALFAIALPDTGGTPQPLEQWRGKVLVVNFWATWCAPCREEMPLFIEAQNKHGRDGLQFVGIAVDDAAKAKQFAAEIGLNYPTLVGGYGAMELSKTLGNRVMALPFTIVIDRSGAIALTQLGPVKPAQLDRIAALTR